MRDGKYEGFDLVVSERYFLEVGQVFESPNVSDLILADIQLL